MYKKKIFFRLFLLVMSVFFFDGAAGNVQQKKQSAEIAVAQQDELLQHNQGEVQVKKAANKSSKKSDAGTKQKAAKKEKKEQGNNQQTDQVQPQHNPKTTMILLDSVQAIVYGVEGTEIITKSDVDRPSLEGKPRSLDDLILERLMYLDAKKFKMQLDEEAIDKHLSSIQRENNLSFNDLKEIFRSAGYTYEEGREQLGMMSAVNSIVDFKIRSRLIVPEKDVIAYYNDHPQKLEALYQLQRGVVPFSSTKTKSALKSDVSSYLQTGVGFINIQWSAPFWIDASEIAEDKQFIFSLVPGQVSQPQEVGDGFELFKLVEKKEERLVTIEERYREIAEILRRPRLEQLLEEYKKNLFETASILYL